MSTTTSRETHTPGPWTLETVRTSCGVCHKIGPFPAASSLHKETFACVYVDGQHDITNSRLNKDAAELLANARLIAASTELLEALRDVLRIATAASIGVSGNAPRLERARAAIAKASQP
jgi:hypothetical protein